MICVRDPGVAELDRGREPAGRAEAEGTEKTPLPLDDPAVTVVSLAYTISSETEANDSHDRAPSR